uniref:Uncharacterized protein n=1 Tax=Rhizophora mucronata TaxID=61149 RepID=A0A2P2PG36_RHIMU
MMNNDETSNLTNKRAMGLFETDEKTNKSIIKRFDERKETQKR